MKNNCSECASGEHEDYTEQTDVVTIKDPDGVQKTRRMHLCLDHQACMIDDGYKLT